MGRIVHQDGFDHYDTAHLPAKWSSISGSTCTIVPDAGRTAAALYATGDTIQKNLPNNYGRLIVGFACKWTINNPTEMFCFTNNSAVGHSAIYLGTNSVGAIVVGDTDQYGDEEQVVTSANALVSAGTWYYFEFDMNFASLALVVRLNGLEVISGTYEFPQFAAGNVANQVAIGFGYGSESYFDDFYCLDPGDATDYWPDTFLGDVTVGSVLMSANGRVNNFIPSPDSNANWENIDEVPPDDDTTFNSSNVVNNVDTYRLESTSVPSVLGVCVVADMRKDNIGSRLVQIGLGNGTEEVYGADIPVSDTYEMSTLSFGQNPFTGAAWEPADLTTLQTAIKVVA
jgi:hypothetical protein